MQKKPIRLLVVEDSVTVRRRLVDILAAEPDIEVAGEAADGKRAIELCRQLRPDVMTMDMMLPLMSGLAATEYIMAYCPTPILVVSASINRGELFKIYEAVQPVDCVLLDLIMPGIGGRETCRRVKNAPGIRDIPIVMLTAVEDRDAMIQGLGAGADDYIAKSSDFDLLRARVLAQIRRKQFEDETRRIREQLLRAELEAVEARAAREMAEERAKLVAELEAKNEELEAFSYSVAHDLRAPLRSIDGFGLALLEDYADKLDDDGKQYLAYVRESAQQMSQLIDDMLALSQVTRGEFERAPVDVTRIARSVGAELTRAVPDRQVDFVVADGLVGEGDARLLTIALENLLGNAWKYTGGRERARIEVGATDGEPRAFFVRDNGAGFDMAYADKLFGMFQRLHAKSEFEGTGIGLATVHRVIRRHGGRIWADAAVGRGATFFFTLDSDRRNAVAAAMPASASHGAPR